MTVEELYKWAKEKNATNFEIILENPEYEPGNDKLWVDFSKETKPFILTEAGSLKDYVHLYN